MSATLLNPQLFSLKNEIERMLSLVELEQDGQPVEVNGFRLRDISIWQNYPMQNAFEAIGSLSGLCNAKCIFCPEQNFPFDRDLSFISEQEAKTRLNYYSPEKKKGLFPSARPYMEQLINPHAIDILKKARKKSNQELFILTTNGSRLDFSTINELSSIQPIFIKLSVNSTDPATRKHLTGISIPDDGCLKVMKLLNEAKIPFTGSIVAWPEVTYESMETTIREISACNPYGIRVRLPLIHQFTKGLKKLIGNIEWSQFWKETAEFVESINVNVPLWIEPVQYKRTPLTPKIDGIILNSPAQQAGILCGDEIISFNGNEMPTRSFIRNWIASGAGDDINELEVIFRRDGKKEKRILRQSESINYPFNPVLRHPGERFGMLFLPDFDIDYVTYLIKIIEKYRAENVLFFCSSLSANTLSMLINYNECYKVFFDKRNLYIYTMEDIELGGNLGLMESRFVRDYERAFADFLSKTREQPDLIIVPNYFVNIWGSDFVGESIYQLQYKAGVPVERIPWHFIYGKED